MALNESVESLLRRALTSLALELGGEGCSGNLRHLGLVLHGGKLRSVFKKLLQNCQES
jgi:hypothetical protein